MSAFGLAVTAGIDFRETASESIIRLEVVWKRSDHVNAKVSINLRRIRGIGHEVIICDIVVSTWDSISCGDFINTSTAQREENEQVGAFVMLFPKSVIKSYQYSGPSPQNP
jgi:hypothetical protein